MGDPTKRMSAKLSASEKMLLRGGARKAFSGDNDLIMQGFLSRMKDEIRCSKKDVDQKLSQQAAARAADPEIWDAKESEKLLKELDDRRAEAEKAREARRIQLEKMASDYEGKVHEARVALQEGL